MNFLLNCAIQISIILSVALLTLPVLRRESAAVRHCVLSVAVVFSLLTPAFNFVMPAIEWSTLVSQHPSIVPIREQISAFTSSNPPPDRSDDASAHNAAAIVPTDASNAAGALSRQLFMVWISGVGLGLLVLLTGLVRLARVASASSAMRSEPWRRLTASISSEYRLNRFVHLLESRNPSVLVTWGAVSPKIILPARSSEWPEDRAGIVLRHELAHVRRRDWLVHMAAQVLRIVFWFNPLVWIVCRRLRLESECACDDIVLSNIQGHEYAAHLLDLARVLNRPGQSWSAALSMARSSTIERRFTAMLNPRLKRYPVKGFALLSMVFAGLVLAMFLSAAGTATAVSAIAKSPVAEPIAEPPATPPIAQPPARARAIAAKSQQIQTVAPQLATQTQSPQSRRGNALDRVLYEVAEEGTISDIEQLLRAGANVNGVVQGDGTPLIGAARKGHIQAVQLLLDRGADPNVPVTGDGTALIVAASEGHIDVVRLLLDRGANPNGEVRGDGNALIMAAREGNTDIVSLLLERGARIDQVVPGDENALISASAAGQLNAVRLLVERRADINARVWLEPTRSRPDGEWRTALSEARRYGHQNVVQFLISVGARD